LVFENSEITGNVAGGGGGCEETGGNGGDGGGIYCGSVELMNCLVSGNRTGGAGATYAGDSGNGGGIFGAATIKNCAVSGNEIGAVRGSPPGEVGSGGGIWGQGDIADSIIWGNSPDQLSGGISVLFSDVDGGCPGVGNIDADPCFASGPLGDYYLSQILAGQPVESPCVDSGSDLAVNLGMDTLTTRTDGEPDTGVVDMGFHYALTTVVDPPWGDELIDEYDLSVLAAKWLWCQ
jgi:hypothetical protein